MNEERLKQIGKFLETRMFIHRQVEHDSPWTTEEKMIVELYDNYINLLMKYKNQKEVIYRIKEYIEPLITNKDDEECYPINFYIKDVLLSILKEVLE